MRNLINAFLLFSVISDRSNIFGLKTFAFSRKSFATSLFAYIPQETVVDNPRVSILTEIADEPGALYDILKYFWKYDIDLTHIESR